MKSTVERRPGITIGELAAHFGLATHVLRHWESMGLLEPDRLPNGRRQYRPEHRTRVAVIVHAREIGLSLDQIRELMGAGDGAARRRTLRGHREDLLRRIEWARASVSLIDHALACDHEDFVECRNFQRLIHRLAEEPGGSAFSPPDSAPSPARRPASRRLR